MRLLVCGGEIRPAPQGEGCSLRQAPQREGHSCIGTLNLGWDFWNFETMGENSLCTKWWFYNSIQSSMNSSQKGKAAWVSMVEQRLKENVEYMCNGILLGLIKRRKKLLADPLLLAFYHQTILPTSKGRLDTHYNMAELWGHCTMNKIYFKRNRNHVKDYLMLIDWLEHCMLSQNVAYPESNCWAIFSHPLSISVADLTTLWLSCGTFWNVLTNS